MPDTEGDSAAVLARARAGDAQAYGVLVRAHQSRVRQQLRRLTRGDHALADDLAQDCFITAWRELARFRGEARFSTWLYRIAYHRFLMHQRSTRSLGAASAAPLAEHIAAGNGAAVLHFQAEQDMRLESQHEGVHGLQRRLQHTAQRGSSSPGEHRAALTPSHEPGSAQAMQIDVERAIARLPHAERAAIIHCYQLDLAQDEAAAILGVPLGTLKTQVARAKVRLRDWLIDWQPEMSR